MFLVNHVHVTDVSVVSLRSSMTDPVDCGKEHAFFGLDGKDGCKNGGRNTNRELHVQLPRLFLYKTSVLFIPHIPPYTKPKVTLLTSLIRTKTAITFPSLHIPSLHIPLPSPHTLIDQHPRP